MSQSPNPDSLNFSLLQDRMWKSFEKLQSIVGTIDLNAVVVHERHLQETA